jgi:cobalt-zinc-cadmium efflux system outer membrane protein
VRSINAAIRSLASLLALTAFASPARAAGEIRISLEDALRAAQQASPELLVARAQQSVAHANVRIAGIYPNPIVSAASNTEAAKISGTVSIPLVVLGQRGAAIDAARADEATVVLGSSVAWNDARQLTERAYAALWLAEGIADARRESAAIEAALEASIVQRVEIGSAPQIDALRVHAEKLRADADVLEATGQVGAAASDLGRWMGVADGGSLRTSKEPTVPDTAPALDTLFLRIDASAPVRREQSDVRAAEARANRERALVRPMMTLDLGFDAFDPTLPQGATNYRALLAVDVPIFHQRGGYIERERSLGDVARARVRAARAFSTAELTGAYRTFEAATARQRTLADEVVPAVRAAAKAMAEAYALGRAPLVAVLDAERALVDTRLSALQAQAARANAWADVEHAVGGP